MGTSEDPGKQKKALTPSPKESQPRYTLNMGGQPLYLNITMRGSKTS